MLIVILTRTYEKNIYDIIFVNKLCDHEYCFFHSDAVAMGRNYFVYKNIIDSPPINIVL